ncbi:MAG: hypothetical protein JEY99_09105 [Spirochaetales bacterium]|nr:hypothetical protein [Spirochaetales bacterium]
MRKICIFVVLISLLFSVSLMAGGDQEEGLTTIVFGDVSWDSVQVHNRIAGFIIENGMDGYKADYMSGDTLPIINGIAMGDIDVDMESWHSNFPEAYEQHTSSGDIIDLGKNMPDAPQGWWIPRYVVEGPDAMAPGLKSVKDLPKYAELFKDPEDPSKSLVYGGVAGWSQMKISEKIFNDNGLSDTYNLGIAGSGAALAGTMVGAYEKGEAWCGYYWAPTAVLGKLDMVRLPGSEYEAADVNILVGKSMLEKAPDVVEFLKKYATTVDDNNEFLAKMDAEDWSSEETAKWFLKNKEDVWTQWLPAEVVERVKAAL